MTDSDGFRPDEVESENVEESGKPFVFGLPAGAPLFLFTNDPLPCAPLPTTSMPLSVAQQVTICLVANLLKEKMRSCDALAVDVDYVDNDGASDGVDNDDGGDGVRC